MYFVIWLWNVIIGVSGLPNSVAASLTAELRGLVYGATAVGQTVRSMCIEMCVCVCVSAPACMSDVVELFIYEYRAT